MPDLQVALQTTLEKSLLLASSESIVARVLLQLEDFVARFRGSVEQLLQTGHRVRPGSVELAYVPGFYDQVLVNVSCRVVSPNHPDYDRYPPGPPPPDWPVRFGFDRRRGLWISLLANWPPAWVSIGDWSGPMWSSSPTSSPLADLRYMQRRLAEGGPVLGDPRMAIRPIVPEAPAPQAEKPVEEPLTPQSLRELLGGSAHDGVAQFDGEGKWRARKLRQDGD